GIARLRLQLLHGAGDGRGIEAAEVGGRLGVEPPARHDRLRAPLFQRRVVEEGVGPRAQDLERERRRLGEVAREDLDLAALHRREQRLQALDVHGVVEDRKSTRLNSSHVKSSYPVFCVKKKNREKNLSLPLLPNIVLLTIPSIYLTIVRGADALRSNRRQFI